MGEFSLMHWLVFGLILMLLFGPSRLPQLGQSLGQAIRGFKKSMNEGLEEPTASAPKPNQQISQFQNDTHQSSNQDMRDVSHNNQNKG